MPEFKWLRAKHILLVTCCTTLLFLSGCGSEKTATVSGTIDFEGVSIPTGLVTFASDQNIYYGQIENGRYQIEHQGKPQIPQGDYAVTVSPPPDESEYNLETGEEVLLTPKFNPKHFPLKYRDKTTSGLSVTLDESENEFDIELTGK